MTVAIDDLMYDLRASDRGCRELSDRMLRFLGWHTVKRKSWTRALPPYRNTMVDVWVMPDGGEPARPPCPTTSVDAALSLMPEDLNGTNPAAVLAAALYQVRIGEIDRRQIPLRLCEKILELRKSGDM